MKSLNIWWLIICVWLQKGEQVINMAQGAGGQVINMAEGAGGQVMNLAQGAGTQVKNVAQGAGEQVKNVAQGATEAVKNTLGMNSDNSNNPTNPTNASNPSNPSNTRIWSADSKLLKLKSKCWFGLVFHKLFVSLIICPPYYGDGVRFLSFFNVVWVIVVIWSSY